MAKGKYEDRTVEQLVVVNSKLTAEREVVRQEKRRLTIVMDRKIARDKVEGIAAMLGDDEKVELAQVLGASAIETEESVGTPGLPG